MRPCASCLWRTTGVQRRPEACPLPLALPLPLPLLLLPLPPLPLPLPLPLAQYNGSWCSTSGSTAVAPASRRKAAATVMLQPLR
jgi:hypothetical protein